MPLPIPRAVYWWALNEWEPRTRKALGAGLETISFAALSPQGGEVGYLVQSRALANTPWHFTLLSPLADLRREAVITGLFSALGFALLVFLLIAWNERRKAIATRLAAREALATANNELERKIAERTEDLRASNCRLLDEINERKQVEEDLRKTQKSLVQAGKLAVIGQMSTSIAHELNQPWRPQALTS